MAESVWRGVPGGQIIRYFVVGGWNTVFSYCVFALFTYLLTGRVPYAYMAATVVSSVINITVAYLGYKFFVFKTKGNYLREYLRCYVVYGGSALIYMALLPFVVGALSFVLPNRGAAPYVAGAVLSSSMAFISFFAHRSYSFGGSHRFPASPGSRPAPDLSSRP